MASPPPEKALDPEDADELLRDVDMTEAVSDEPDYISHKDTSSDPISPLSSIKALANQIRQSNASASSFPRAELLSEAAPPNPDWFKSLQSDKVAMKFPSRPTLLRGNSTLDPPPLPSPTFEPDPEDMADNDDMQLPALPNTSQEPEDSLTPSQLRQVVTDGGLFPSRTTGGKLFEHSPYAFEYGDAGPLPVELDEWFTYAPNERARIARIQASFDSKWLDWKNINFWNHELTDTDWTCADDKQRVSFIIELISNMSGPEDQVDIRSLESLLYIALGTWGETAGLKSVTGSESTDSECSSTECFDEKYDLNTLQFEWIRKNTQMIFHADGLPVILEMFKTACDNARNDSACKDPDPANRTDVEHRDIWCTTSFLYVFLEVARTSSDESQKLKMREMFLTTRPNLFLVVEEVIDAMRYDDTINLPILRLISLLWKAELVMLGGLKDAEAVRDSFRTKEPARLQKSKPLITASPLAYHAFHCEIISKYPSYTPPPLEYPLDPYLNTLLPSVNSHMSIHKQMNMDQNASSIMTETHYIGTPAPSPPPSPAAGKSGKRQNYQTNQLFPFLYPPLDSTSNDLGGRGTTSLQDSLVGRKWTGMDIPCSIAEASELFKSRVRTTRSSNQIWDERCLLLDHKRGWDAGLASFADESVLPEPDDWKLEDAPQKLPQTARVYDGSVKDRLAAVEDLYRDGLPHLQSIIMVVMRKLLANLSTYMSQATLQALQSNSSMIFTTGASQQEFAPGKENDAHRPTSLDTSAFNVEELDVIRTQEITTKVVAGFIFVLLKWFKVSHILKFEYLTQIMLDATFVPLILKIIQTQDMERIVHQKVDRKELDFFHYCRTLSHYYDEDSNDEGDKAGRLTPESSASDDAMPPPIRRHRKPVEGDSVPDSESNEADAVPVKVMPEVNELGVPITAMPEEKITDFSRRNMFSLITFMRILQKMCKGKTHRNLMLVTYKSSNYMKKILRIPQKELRLYTLKLFKNQAPYCGRKWRQANMRVITAIYLHCRPELRDNWLLSAEVDHDIELSVPLEKSLRSLTEFYNARKYPEQIGAKKEDLEEPDFFALQLGREYVTSGGLAEDYLVDIPFEYPPAIYEAQNGV